MQWEQFTKWLERNGWRKSRFYYYKDTKYFMCKVARLRLFKGQVLISARDFFDNDKWKTVSKIDLKSLSVNQQRKIVQSYEHKINRI